MGTDVHAVWQKKLVRNDSTVTNYWVDVPAGDWELTADEILAAPRPDQGTLLNSGIITAEDYATWDKVSAPLSYCGGIDGPKVKVAESEQLFAQGGYTHVRVQWLLRGELDYFVDEVRRMRANHGETLRLVMGFDS